MLTTTAADYITWDPCAETRAQVETLLNQNNSSGLSNILTTRLAFGTAGLRGPMGAGYNRMNDLVILQTIQGLIAYLKETVGEQLVREKGFIIGYDHRELGTLSSRHFAEICVSVLLSQRIHVFLLEGFVPTPFVPFGVTHYGCAAGIMVTASHNPKEDNGFKVYMGNGAQIIPPHDAGIASSISENLKPWQSHYDTSMGHFLSHGELFCQSTEEVAELYYSRMETVSVPAAPLENPLSIVYTAMHGVGSQWVERAFSHVQRFNHLSHVSHVPSQKEPDPSFPTVSFPNPEEKGALDEAMRYARESACDLIIANDPDADRFAAAERIPTTAGTDTDITAPQTSSWRLFTGNEVGIILGHSQIQQYVEALKGERDGGGGGPGENGTFIGQTPLPLKAAVVTTVVSSKMLQRIAETEGVFFTETLTGFKWIGNECLHLQKEGYKILFSYEEAIGYCVGDALTDKDGISAAIVFCELASRLRSRGITVTQHLNDIYSKYGLCVSHNIYLFSYEQEVTEKIFQRLRCGGVEGGYILSVGDVRVTRVRDITRGYDSGTDDKRSSLPSTPDSHMIMYEFDNDCTVVLRTSGTEPKIKVYSELSSRDSDSGGACTEKEQSDLSSRLVSFVSDCVTFMLKPEENGLVSA